jgi:hypothetical protein
MISIHSYFCKHVLIDMDIHPSKENCKILKHFEPNYLSRYLNQMNNCFFENSIVQKKHDQIMAKNVYLQIQLCLIFTFDILFSHKINFQQN